jgi:hypothetical protein
MGAIGVNPRRKHGFSRELAMRRWRAGEEGLEYWS